MLSTYCDNSELSDLYSICSDTSTIESLNSSASNMISEKFPLDDDLVCILSDSFVTAKCNL